MRSTNITIVVSAALVALGLHSLGRGIANSSKNREIRIDHRIQFDTNDPFPSQLDVNLGIQGKGSPALHIRLDQ